MAQATATPRCRPTITLGVYGHLFANTDEEAAEIIAAAFARAKTE